MDLTQIRYFLALTRTLNFTRAAEACNVTQPALSKSIQRLEDEFGGPLLFREQSLTQLTELGRTMLPLLQQTWDAAEAARHQAASFRQKDRAPLRIGLGPGVSASLLGPLVRELERRFKGLQLSLSHGATDELNESLLHGRLDVAITGDLAALAERVHRWPLYADRIAVLMPQGHPLALGDQVSAAALNAHTLVSRTEDADLMARMLDRLRAELGLPLQVQHRGSNEEEIQQLVLAGMGVALTTERRPRPADLETRLLADPALTYEVAVAVVAGRPLTRAADALVRLCRARDWNEPAAPL